jgi:hypothetical protein
MKFIIRAYPPGQYGWDYSKEFLMRYWPMYCSHKMAEKMVEKHKLNKHLSPNLVFEIQRLE